MIAMVAIVRIMTPGSWTHGLMDSWAVESWTHGLMHFWIIDLDSHGHTARMTHDGRTTHG